VSFPFVGDMSRSSWGRNGVSAYGKGSDVTWDSDRNSPVAFVHSQPRSYAHTPTRPHEYSATGPLGRPLRQSHLNAVLAVIVYQGDDRFGQFCAVEDCLNGAG
jgi:hypothetical protein